MPSDLAIGGSFIFINAAVIASNLFVLVLIISQRILHTPTNAIVLSLTISDFLLGIIVLPFSIIQELRQEWIFDRLFCNIWLGLDVWFSTASIFNLIAITYDRYMAVKEPITYKFVTSVKLTKKTISLVWIVSAVLALPKLIYDCIVDEFFRKPGEIDHRICTPMQNGSAYIVVSATISFILPIASLAWMNLIIYRRIINRKMELANGAGRPSEMAGIASLLEDAPNDICGLRIHKGGKVATATKVKVPREYAETRPLLSKEATTNMITIQNSSSTPTFNTKNSLSSSDEIRLLGVGRNSRSKNRSASTGHVRTSFSLVERVTKAVQYPVLFAFMFTWNTSQKRSRLEHRSARTEARVARTVGIVVGCFILCWLPFSTLYSLQAYDLCPLEACVPGWLFTLTLWLGYANSAVNPIIYSALSNDFRAAISRMLRRRRSRRQNDNEAMEMRQSIRIL